MYIIYGYYQVASWPARICSVEHIRSGIEWRSHVAGHIARGLVFLWVGAHIRIHICGECSCAHVRAYLITDINTYVRMCSVFFDAGMFFFLLPCLRVAFQLMVRALFRNHLIYDG